MHALAARTTAQIHTDAKIVGAFNSSADPILTRVMTASLASQRSVFHSIPLDCPQRERHGCVG